MQRTPLGKIMDNEKNESYFFCRLKLTSKYQYLKFNKALKLLLAVKEE